MSDSFEECNTFLSNYNEDSLPKKVNFSTFRRIKIRSYAPCLVPIVIKITIDVELEKRKKENLRWNKNNHIFQ